MFDAENAIHQEAEQQRRQKSALKLNVKNIDFENQKGIINDYEVTLDECQCRDWYMRRLPCKHIYRLAHELGIFPLSGKVENVKCGNVVQQRMERKVLKEKACAVPEAARLLLYDIIRDIKQIPRTTENEKNIGLLLAAELVVVKQPAEADISKKCTIKAMREFAPDAPKGLNKSNLMEYMRVNHKEFMDKIYDDFNANYIIAEWPEQYNESRIAVQRAITPYKGDNEWHETVVSIDLSKLGTKEGVVKIERIR